jgi:hypothetical protein
VVWNPSGTYTASDPPIDVRLIWRDSFWGSNVKTWEEWAEERRIAMPEGRRKKLLAMMLGGASAAEREAAARALLVFPEPGYRLRVAEWGVWVAKGGYISAARQSGAMPGFVHEAGDSIASLAKERMMPSIDINKPVIHLTASAAMAVDVEVRIRGGRPTSVFPMPDDYAVQIESGSAREHSPEKASVSSPDAGRLGGGSVKLRQGYPWLTPAHPVRVGDFVSEVGVRWQSLIVSPAKLSWMKEAAVDAGGPAGWWSRLREVEGTSWVSSRGESERFLYYDGPTSLRLPVNLERVGDGMMTRPGREGSVLLLPTWSAGGRRADFPAREGMRVRVSGSRVVKGERVRVPMSTLRSMPVEVGETLKTGRVSEAFEAQVRSMGLTAPEAAGMAACWRREWFETDGERVLLFLEARDYELFCPMRVRPAPTELVRVGVVWLEF